MQYVRTQVYLQPEQHRQLKAEASRRGISLAGLLRQIIDEAAAPARPKSDLSGIIGLGDSGGGDIARHKHDYLAQAIAEHQGRASPRRSE